MPRGKLKSFTAAFFYSSDNVDAFMEPAMPMMAIPSRVTATPNSTEVVRLAKATCSGKKILSRMGPITVPSPAHVPKAMLCPKATPR